jgi:hypothetical protein
MKFIVREDAADSIKFIGAVACTNLFLLILV